MVGVLAQQHPLRAGSVRVRQRLAQDLLLAPLHGRVGEEAHHQERDRHHHEGREDPDTGDEHHLDALPVLHAGTGVGHGAERVGDEQPELHEAEPEREAHDAHVLVPGGSSSQALKVGRELGLVVLSGSRGGGAPPGGVLVGGGPVRGDLQPTPVVRGTTRQREQHEHPADPRGHEEPPEDRQLAAVDGEGRDHGHQQADPGDQHGHDEEREERRLSRHQVDLARVWHGCSGRSHTGSPDEGTRGDHLAQREQDGGHHPGAEGEHQHRQHAGPGKLVERAAHGGLAEQGLLADHRDGQEEDEGGPDAEEERGECVDRAVHEAPREAHRVHAPARLICWRSLCRHGAGSLSMTTRKGPAVGRALHPVELGGLEPPTPCMPCRCATSCATAPNCVRPGGRAPSV